MSKKNIKNNITKVEELVIPEEYNSTEKELDYIASQNSLEHYIRFCAIQCVLAQVNNKPNKLFKMLEGRGKLIEDYFEEDKFMRNQIKTVSYFLEKGYDFIQNSLSGEVKYDGFVSDNWWLDKNCPKLEEK